MQIETARTLCSIAAIRRWPDMQSLTLLFGSLALSLTLCTGLFLALRPFVLTMLAGC